MGKPKGRRGLPLQSACDEYQCPCHSKLDSLITVVESIYDEADHALYTEAEKPEEIHRTNLRLIRRLAAGARLMLKGR